MCVRVCLCVHVCERVHISLCVFFSKKVDTSSLCPGEMSHSPSFCTYLF